MKKTKVKVNPMNAQVYADLADDRAERLRRVYELHKKTETQKHPRCMECGMTYPCRTRQIALGEPVNRPATVGELP